MHPKCNVARALTWRYGVAFALIAALSTATWLGLHQIVSEQKDTAARVNIGGRQRMLSQRTALLAYRLIHEPAAERPAIRDKLSAALQLMTASHRTLIGQDETGSPPAEMSATVQAMYFEGPEALSPQVENHIATLYGLLQLPDQQLNPNDPALRLHLQSTAETLVVALDRMVRQYQLEGEASVRRLRQAETIFWLLTLALLALEAALIFNPFVRHLKEVMGKLQQSSEQLQSHQLRLEANIRQRTTQLAESEEKFRLICTTAQDAIAIIDSNEQVVYWNPAAERLFGYRQDEMTGKNLHATLLPPRYQQAAYEGFRSFRQAGVGPVIGKTIELVALHRNGSEFPVELSVSAFKFRDCWHALGIVRDISERRKEADHVHQLAFYDPLTTLPNRRLLTDRLNQVMIGSKRNRQYAALMMLDLDNFKPLNDTFGHALGDKLLVETAARLRACVREVDTVARFGGDEFVVLLNELGSEKSQSLTQAGLVAEKIRIALSEPYQLATGNCDVIEHVCSVSIGVVVFVTHKISQDDLLNAADAAMYKAKQSGRNQIQFDESHPV